MKAIIQVLFPQYTDIETCFLESIELARKLECTIQFEHNEITCFATENGTVETGVKNYYKAAKDYPTATSRFWAIASSE